MKIVILMHSFYENNIGGAEYQAYIIGKELKNKGHEVHYIYTRDVKKRIDNPNNFHLHPIKKNRSGKLSQLKLIYYFKIISKLKTIKPDIIYHRNLSSFLAIAVNYKKRNNVRIITHIASDNDVKKHKFNFLPRKILKSVDTKIKYRALKTNIHIITQTLKQKSNLLNNYGLKSSVIYNFCEIPDEVQIKNKENIVVWIANLKKIKNPFDFIKLAERFKNSDYRFIMIGKEPSGHFGRQFKELLSKSGDNIEYLGGISNDEVNRMLEKAKILCCTSYGEGFSNTFIQAWARKVPVLSLYVNPDNIIKENQLGYHSNDFKTLVEDLNKLINSPEMLSDMGEKAYQYAIKNFSLHKNFSKFITLLNHKKE